MNHPWEFVRAAYIVSGIGVAGLIASVVWSLRRWATRARELERD